MGNFSAIAGLYAEAYGLWAGFAIKTLIFVLAVAIISAPKWYWDVRWWWLERTLRKRTTRRRER